MLLLACLALLPPALSRGENAHTAIVGGTVAEPGAYPWQVQVTARKGSSSYLCGGTLIADRRVLTAAHCVLQGSKITVRVGSHTFDAGTRISVASYARHPNYNANTSRYDVAVLELAASGVAAGGEPLELIGEEGFSAVEDAYWAPGKMLAISGWGSTSYQGESSDQLQEAHVPRVSDSTCAQADYYGSEFDPGTMVCAGFADGGVDSCQGDSGGPLAASRQDPPPDPESNPTEWRLVGVTSWGDECALPKKPGVYARVAAPTIRNWILGIGPALFSLTVAPTGTGSGVVLSGDGNVDCPPTCSFSYTNGTSVTLTATADPGSEFAGWSGGGCSGTGTSCTVTMDQARTVSAMFTNTSGAPTQRLLTVARQGGGQGMVTSSPAGIDCGTACSATFDHGTVVTLTPTSGSGSTFIGWEGEGCPNLGACTLTMDQARNVTATFGVEVTDETPAEPDEAATTADKEPPLARIRGRRMRMNDRGFVRIRISCIDPSEDCPGDLDVRLRFPDDAARSTVGQAGFELAAGERIRVKARLKRRARRLVRREEEVRAKVVAFVHDDAGNRRKVRKVLTLRPG